MRNKDDLTEWAQSFVDKYTRHPWKARAEGRDYGRKLGLYAWQEGGDGKTVKEEEFRPFSVLDLNDAEIERGQPRHRSYGYSQQPRACNASQSPRRLCR